MGQLAEIIDRATVPAQAVARLKLFPATDEAGDRLFGALSGVERDALTVTRERRREITVAREGRVWSSVEAAFAASRVVADAYALDACEPDIAVPVMPVDRGRPSERAAEESLDDLRSGCWAEEEPDLKERKNWAVTLIKADKAWAFARARGLPSAGEGIVIAQPDTGIVAHVELRGIPFRSPRNLLGDAAPDDPTDPLPDAGNPGHGTATASVVVSRGPGEVTGSAPAASLMPIRAIERVVQPSMMKVAEAVDHAVASGAHVITMSLGGIWSYSLWAAIERAVAADLIVMAAAGNCVGTVVWPAQFDACLGIAAVDQHFKPWRGTSMGSQVDIAAPGQNVYRANAKTGDAGQGQGTSFAVALTAGVAACWLAFHGRATLVAAAHDRGETLQAMFRRLLQATAQRPNPWDATRMGAGIVDAEALLAAGLDRGRGTESSVRSGTPRIATSSLQLLAVDKVGLEALDPSVDWIGHGGEISRQLLAGQSSAEILKPTVAKPALRREVPAATLDRAQRLRNKIVAADAAAEGASLESASTLESTGAAEITPAMADRIVDRMVGRIEQLPEQEASDKQAVRSALAMLVEHGRNSLQKLTGLTDIQSAHLIGDDLASLEAIVVADGSRPSFMLEGGEPPATHPFMGSWGPTVARLQSAIGAFAPAIGRIQPAGGHNGRFIGTGTLVDAGKGLILTNFHVLDDAMRDYLVPTQRTGPDTIRILGNLEIDFLGEAKSLRSNRFRIVEAKLHPASGRGFGHLDAVTMRIEPMEAGANLPTRALTFDPDALAFNNASGSDFCTIGFPGPPDQTSDTSGQVDWDFVIKTLFGNTFGVKRLAPGRVTQGIASVPGDTMEAVFAHDATTFGGASGSPILAWNVDGQPAIGLHFSGKTRSNNYALANAAITDQLRALGVPFASAPADPPPASPPA